MSCSCGCSPCCCNTSGEIDASECIDPGIVKTSAYAAVINEDMCGRRLAAYRGLRDDGTPDTRPASAIKAAILTQDEEGVVSWSAGSCGSPTKKVAKVANDTDAADTTNFISRLVAKGADHCDVSLAGSADAASGQWKLVWVASMQAWTTVPDTGEGSVTTDLCTTLDAAMVISPGTEEYVIEVISTAHVAAGVSLKIQGYEFVVTEVINDEYLRVELFDTISAPVTIAAGETVCNIGFRPCPRSAAPYSDNLVACLNGSSISIELPPNVNDVPVPGIYWRNQLGRVAFLPAEVDPVTGLAMPGQILKTTPTPVAGGANLPGWETQSSGWTWVAPVTAFSQSGSGPTWGTTTFDTAGVTGKPAGAKVAILEAYLYSATDSGSYYTAKVTVNDIVALMATLHSNFECDADSNMLFVPIESSSVLTMAVSRIAGAGNGSNTWELMVKVRGFIS